MDFNMKPGWYIIIVDRIEGELAICEDEDRKTRPIPLSELPDGLREGDCLRKTGMGYTIDPQETARRRQENKALFEKLIKRSIQP